MQHPETMTVERNGNQMIINKSDFNPETDKDPNEKPKRSPGRPKRKTEDSDQWQNTTEQ